jgi:hypothetical protein
MVRITIAKSSQQDHSANSQGLNLHVHHTTPQTRRQGLRVPPEDIHHHGPGHTRENGVGIIRDLSTCVGRNERREGVHIGLHSEFGEGKHHSREHVNYDLEYVSTARHERRGGSPPKSNIPAD